MWEKKILLGQYNQHIQVKKDIEKNNFHLKINLLFKINIISVPLVYGYLNGGFTEIAYN